MRGIQSRLAALGCACLLAACGGGGGGGGSSPPPAPPPPPPPPPALIAQSIAFADPGMVDRTLEQGDFTNVATGGAGTGVITYASSDTAVATVDANGAVTVLAPGLVEITATKAADAVYASATRSYVLLVQRPAGVPFSASLSEQGAQDVEFPAWARGLDFLRSTQADCDVAQFSACADNQAGAITATAHTFMDSAATITRAALWWLRRGGTVGAPLHFSVQKFPTRSGPALASLGGKLWLVGGLQTNVYLTNDVWNSTDGVFWTRVGAGGPFAARNRAQLLAFNDRLWLIAGNGGNGGNGNGLPTSGDVWLGDVWSSSDGITWRQETANAPFGGRFDHAAVVFGGRLWVIGGSTPTASASDDAWWSTDGVSWTAVNDLPFGDRSGHTVTAYGDRLYLIGGRDAGGTRFNDVWSSADGLSWTRDTAAAAFTPRAYHVAAVVDGRLNIVGGTTDNKPYSGEAWSSTDGINWTGQDLDQQMLMRRFRGAAVHDGLLFLAGGEYREAEVRPQGGGELFFVDEVLAIGGSFLDPHRTPYARFPPGPARVAALDGRLYRFGGLEDGRESRFIYSSDDGYRWVRQGAATFFDERARYAVTAHDDRLWVAGGNLVLHDGLLHWNTDVWHSTDGAHWQIATQTAPWGRREGLMLTSFNGQLVVVGGRDDSANYLNDVWTSVDGAAWTPLTANAAFPARAFGSLLVFDGRLWLFGGRGAAGLRADAWSSADGITWQLEDADLPGGAREGTQVAAHDGRLWITGGRFFVPAFFGYDYQSELYSSTDGRTWNRTTYAGRRFSPRRDAGFLSFGGRLWMAGGVDDYGPRSDVWSSADGELWSVKLTATIPYP